MLWSPVADWFYHGDTAGSDLRGPPRLTVRLDYSSFADIFGHMLTDDRGEMLAVNAQRPVIWTNRCLGWADVEKLHLQFSHLSQIVQGWAL